MTDPINPFTTTREITTMSDSLNTDPLNRIINDEPTYSSYDPETTTLIDGTVLEIDTTGGQRFSNGKTLVDTVKHTQSIAYIDELTKQVKKHADSYVNLNTRTNAATAGFRKFLEALWGCGVDQTTLNTLFEEHNLPTQLKTFSFTGKITIEVYGVRGTGKDEDDAWDKLDTGAWEEALNEGNYNGYNIDEPYSYEEAEEVDGDDDEDPDFSAATIWDLA